MASVARRVLTGAMVAAAAAAVVVSVGGTALADPAAVATNWNDLQADVSAGGLVVLGADISGSGDSLIVGPSPVTLDLNGNTLTADASGRLGRAGIEVPAGASLTIQDSSGGGSIDARGGGGAAGIGGAADEAAGSVAVRGGYVSAYGGDGGAYGEGGGAGIGGGSGGSGGALVVSAGSVEANGTGTGAGIGGGSDGSGGSVTVSGGSLTAISSAGAGIGEGADFDEVPVDAGSVHVSGGSLTATGGYLAAGVGGSAGKDGGSVSVSGGGLTASGGYGGAGVGGGSGGAAGSVTVSGGLLTATGGRGGGSGIGPGSGDGSGGSLFIGVNGSVTAADAGDGNGASAIGGSQYSAATSFGSVTNEGVLTIPDGATLFIPSGATIENLGEITGEGTIDNAGAIQVVGSGDVDIDTRVNINHYTLFFSVNGGSGPAPDLMRVYAATVGDGNETLPAGPSGHSAFVGWFTAPTNGTLVTDTTDLASAAGTTGPVGVWLYAQYAKPVVTSLSPASGPAAGGPVVTITGSYLTGATRVTFGGTAASFHVDSDTQITATAPAHPAGKAGVVVRTAMGTSASTPGDVFTFLNRPWVASVTPNSGPVAGGRRVTISGSGFAGATQVLVGGTPAASFTVRSATTIVATVPAGQAGPADITVTTPNGTSDVASGDRYSYGYLPTVTAISPNRGPSTGGQTITVTGTSFTGTGGTTTVTFGNVVATAVVDSDTQLTVTVPGHVSGGGYTKGVVYLNVTTDVGVTAHTPADLYTYTG